MRFSHGESILTITRRTLRDFSLGDDSIWNRKSIQKINAEEGFVISY